MTRTSSINLCLLLLGLLSGLGAMAQPHERMFTTFNASNGLADNSAQTIRCTKTGRMVISTIGHINFYDGDSFVHIDPEPEDSYPLPKYNGHYHIYFDKHHHLWLKDKRSVTCLDLLTERFIRDVGGAMKDVGMTGPVDDLFADGNNFLWFLSGNMLHGVDLDMRVPLLQDGELQDLDVYRDSLLLQYFANGSVSVYDLKAHRPSDTSTALEGDDAARYSASSVLLADGSRYYQIRNGAKESVLLCFDVESRQWQKLMALPYHMNNMVQHEGWLYIACEYGYWTYDPASGQALHFETLKLQGGRELVTDVNTLAFDRQGGLWMGTEKRGLLYAKPFPSPFVTYTWDRPEALRYGSMLEQHAAANAQQLSRHVNCRVTDSRGWTWTGTYTGLEVLIPGSDKPRKYTVKDGLLNEMVHSVVEDDDHNIWISTSYGISFLRIEGDKVSEVVTYTRSDNVPEESFVNDRAMRLADGTIVMQSLDHVVTFHPKRFMYGSLNDMPIYPKLIRLMLNGQNLKPGTEVDGKVILEKSITRTFDLTINYDQNTLSLTFSGLNFFRPIQTFYRVRVKGLYNEWRMLTYTNSNGLVDKRGLLHLPLIGLQPGTYEVEVQVSTSADRWLNEPVKWVIHVEEPWWRTTGVYLLLALLVGLLGLLNAWYYVRNMRLRLKRNNEEEVIMKQMRSYCERCSSLSGEVLSAHGSSVVSKGEPDSYLDKEYVEGMLKIVPYVNAHREEQFRLGKLAAVAGMDKVRLFELLVTNLYRSPRLLMSRLRLQQAVTMLEESDLSVEEIASQLRFSTPNYFIASFYHVYRRTPQEYREGKR